MFIRKAQSSDFERIMEIYGYAQDFMIRSGNPDQWGHRYPDRELVEEDIASGISYVVCDGEKIHGVFVFMEGPEPTYQTIESGRWLNDDPYAVIHRVAGDGEIHGLFRSIVGYCGEKYPNLRIDTHEKNAVMQKRIKEQGFVRCGIVHMEDGTPRTAFQRQITYIWTDGANKDFENFYRITEEYYNKLVGGFQNRRGFAPYNVVRDIKDVLVVYENGIAIGCAGFKVYSGTDVEIKRVWVQPEYRRRHFASEMVRRIERRAKDKGYKRALLQTRKIMEDAIGFYEKIGYSKTDNYPPYDKLDGAVCLAKELI